MKFRFILFILCVFFLGLQGIFADVTVIPPRTTVTDIPDVYAVEEVIPGIIAYFISLTAVLAILGITWGSIKIFLAAGEDEKVKKGRMTIIYSFIGLVVAGLAFSVVEIITRLDIG